MDLRMGNEYIISKICTKIDLLQKKTGIKNTFQLWVRYEWKSYTKHKCFFFSNYIHMRNKAK